MASQHINMLLQAEAEAEEIIKRARDNWTAKIAEARKAAEKICSEYREKELAKLDKLQNDKTDITKDIDKLERESHYKIENIGKSFKEKREEIFHLHIASVVKVNLHLDEEKKFMIKQAFLDNHTPAA